MRTYYRKKYPYYGIYKCKAELNWNDTRNKFKYYDLIRKLNKLLGRKNYKLYGYYGLYLKDEKYLDILLNDDLQEHIMFVYKPAPGYEHLTGKAPKEEKKLWYKRYPYKITIALGQFTPQNDKNEADTIERWCNENIQHDYMKSGTWGNVSFFFLNKLDAVAFKLTYCDIVEKQHVLNKKDTVKAMNRRIKQARDDLAVYLKGEEQ